MLSWSRRHTVLESDVRIKAIAGYDPTLGIMHEKREGSSYTAIGAVTGFCSPCESKDISTADQQPQAT
jgi:hypothetical protein